ncbi:ATP-binding protein [Nitratidesulfovibrio sp. SRB-5]|uniref:ATP-binding protein n=1 Tax=Nitratidesulfovibrio sp. SRB-5 TaxID=2872636 RepID=UPI001CBA6B05|nr:ATP-binding protein [Nitratidesulfovibrio sp. SRB-5]
MPTHGGPPRFAGVARSAIMRDTAVTICLSASPADTLAASPRPGPVPGQPDMPADMPDILMPEWPASARVPARRAAALALLAETALGVHPVAHRATTHGPTTRCPATHREAMSAPPPPPSIGTSGHTSGQDATASRAARLSLLIVSEFEEFARGLVARLAACGLEPSYMLAETPFELSRLITEEPWDMVVAESEAPGMTWQEVLMLVRGVREDVPFVLVAPAADEGLALEAVREGADEVLCADDWHLGPAFMRLVREAERRRTLSVHWREINRDARQWRGMVEGTVLGIFRCRPWGELISANPAFADMFGYPSPDALFEAIRSGGAAGVAPGTTMPEGWLPGGFLDRATLDRMLNTLRDEGEVRDFETPARRADGSTFWISVNARVQRGSTGEISGIEGTVEDIDRRKAVENMIIRAKQEWEKTFDSVPDIIMIMDAGQRVRRSNMALGRLLGLHPKDLVGRHCNDVLGASVMADDVCAAIRGMPWGESRTEELYLPSLGGHFLVTLSPFLADSQYDGEPVREGDAPGTVLVAHDISSRKQLEARLRQAQKMEAIGTLAGGIAHDFNNILGVMMGYTEMSLDQTEEGDAQHRRLTEVLAAGRRARDLIRQILTFSRQEEPSRLPLPPLAPIKETVRLLRATLPANVDIRLDLAETGPLLANLSQLQQVIMNLCANAAHAMKEHGGVLHLALDAVELDEDEAAARSLPAPGGYARLRVRDTGHGIPPDIMENIFDPFFTTKKPDEGTGMGLALVHGIVTAHGGAVAVQSTVGVGTEFEVLLPLAPQAGEEAATRADSAHSGSGLALVVDDEAPLAAIMGAMLEKLGYRAVVTANPQDALERFRADPASWRLVVTDQTMPGMTGTELTRQMRALRPDLPVVLCSGFSEGLGHDAAMEAGVSMMLAKPLLRADLAAALSELGLENGKG